MKMKLTALTTIICMFSVVIPIQSSDIIYDYNYDNFGEIFPQGDGVNDFHLYKYANIDDIFDEKYEGTNVGGAFLVKGDSWQVSDAYIPGHVASITATFYCGSTWAEEGGNILGIGVYYVDGAGGGTYLCQERGWHYNYTWTPPYSVSHQGFKVAIEAHNATINQAYGFDMLRITTTNTTTSPA